MDFSSQAATAAKTKVALVNAVGFLFLFFIFFDDGLQAHLFALSSIFALLLHLFRVLNGSRESCALLAVLHIFLCN